MGRTIDGGMSRFAGKIRERTVDLAQQLERAEKDYPDVVLALRAQQVMIAELFQYHPGLVPESTEILDALGVNVAKSEDTLEFSRRLEKLQRCLMRAETYSDDVACFDAFEGKD